MPPRKQQKISPPPLIAAHCAKCKTCFKIKRDYRAAHRESAPLQKLKKQFGFTVEAALDQVNKAKQ